MDYEQDLEFIRNIYSNVSFKGVISLSHAMDYLGRNPDVAKINQHCVQLQLDPKSKGKIDKNYRDNLEKIKEIKRLRKKIYSF